MCLIMITMNVAKELKIPSGKDVFKIKTGISKLNTQNVC